MTEGVITEWLIEEGGQVKEGQPLFAMETDKLTITIDASVGGTLLKIIRPAGDTVPITETIAIVGELGEDYSALLGGTAPSAAPALASPTAAVTVAAVTASAARSKESGKNFASPRAKTRAAEKNIDINAVVGSGPDGLVIERDVLTHKSLTASPLARKLAERDGVDLRSVVGGGARGKIMAADIPTSVPPAKPSRGERIIPLSGMRRTVARRMKDSLNIAAQANHRITADMSESVRLREQLKANGVKVSYNDIVLRCVAKALTDCPYMNVSYTEDGIIQKDYVNLGVAVALDDGLIVPVIPDADLLTLPQLAAASADLAGRAKEKRLQPQEYTGGTFTVSNLGMFGLTSFTAILNPPEAGILAVGRMERKPVVLDDGSIAARPLIELTLTYDHMAVDGAPAARFLQRIKTLLETPTLML